MNFINRIVAFCIGGYKTNNHKRIFKNTLYWLRHDASLMASVRDSIYKQEVIKEKDSVFNLESARYSNCKISISQLSAYEVARKHEGEKVCALNFASALNPGGGVTISTVRSGQEESLCRQSSLYLCLSDDCIVKQFYTPHRDFGNNLHNDDVIYTPGVIVFKDNDNNLIDKQQWFKVDVISCAAPNVGAYRKGEPNFVGVSEEELLCILKKRIKRIFEIAVSHDVEVLVLGAFGCGAFGNSPYMVANVFRREVEEYQRYFAGIEFAITGNKHYEIFKEVFQ